MAPDPVSRPLDHLPAMGAPDAPALIDRQGAMTFADLEAATGLLAAAIAGRVPRAGERVATWLPKTRIACTMPLAAARAGLVHVPINPVLKRAQVAHILADSGARLLVTQAARASTLEAGDVPDGCVVVEGDTLVSADAMPPSEASPDTLAALLYTSGSTGRPKGVMLSHANLWLGAVAVARYLRLGPRDRVLGVLPLGFDYGQNQLFSAWAAGAAVAPLDYLTPRDVIRAVGEYGATTLAGVPPLWTQLLEADWPTPVAASLRRLTNSGGALTPRMVRAIRSRFPAADLYAMYGLTEAFRSTYLEPDLVDAHPDAIGRAIPFAEIAVVRPDGGRCEPGEAGELVHAGPLVAQGYWRDPERSALRFRPAPDWMQSGGRAAWSGDTVVEGADGLLRFIGRADETIKTAGNRVSPNEIEEAVLAGGEVAEAAAVGVADERLGQAIVVVARPAEAGGEADAEAAVRARLRRDLPSYQQPFRYQWVDALPRGSTGKLDRVAIRRRVEDGA